MRVVLLGVVMLLGGCRQILGLDDLPARLDATVGNDDAPLLQDAFVPDAGACSAISVECAGPTLRVCSVIGENPVDTPCAWGCATAPTPHCALLQPSGGALVANDLVDDAGLADATITTATTTIDTDTGAIANLRTAGTGVRSGIDFQLRGNVGVFRFKSLVVDGNELQVVGSRALAIAAIGAITVKAHVDAKGNCEGNTAGAGGFAGGQHETNGGGTGGGARGQGTTDKGSGGGGGGFGGVGGRGGGAQGQPTTAGGLVNGDELVTMLIGGGGGGGGGGNNGGTGGAGGGAIQLAANGTIRIETDGIGANGCGGARSNNNDGGAGGGGAGGAILVEAPSFELAALAFLVANGGGGGGAAGGNDGQDGQLGAQHATGGIGGNQGGRGGDGGAGNDIGGTDGMTDTSGGGGGGGAGRIRINTFATANAQLSGSAVLSPTVGPASSTTTLGIANIQ